MSDSYTKLFSSIVASTIVSEPVATRWLWVTLLAQADANGDVHGSVPGMARIANITLEETERALECFLSPDRYSRTKDNDGRRVIEIDGGWHLLNHGKYRKIRSAEERREYKRIWDAEHRPSGHQRSKQSDDGQHSPTQSDAVRQSDDSPTLPTEPTTPAPPPAPVIKEKALVPSAQSESLFEKFWKAYPARPGKAKVGKKPCATKWKARKLDTIADKILANVEWHKKNNQEWREGFAPNPETYLNQDRWDDGNDLGTTGQATAHPIGASPAKEKTAEQMLEQRIIGLRDLWERYGNEAAKAELESLGVKL